MPLTIDASEIAWRLALSVLAGILLGFNRAERGRPAGLCTTTLVSVAACLSMIQVNLLLGVRGKTPDSFGVMDLMRLPLGILTGMGFIGGGAILRRGSVVQGVTTAATLWLATVLGLCFGGGQVGLGLAGLGVGLAILWTLKWAEQHLREDRRATLELSAEADGLSDPELRESVQTEGYSIISWDVTYRKRQGASRRTIRCSVRWHGPRTTERAPVFVKELADKPGVRAVRWKTWDGA